MSSEDAVEGPADALSTPLFGQTHHAVSVWSANGGGEAAGGDWCIVLPISDDAVALSIGDVCGHGIAASGTMARARAAIVGALAGTQVPSDVLALANAVAYAGDGVRGEPTIVTAIVALFDRRRQTLTFANAGHPPPLVTTGIDHAFLGQPPADLPLGIYSAHQAANYVVALSANALLVLYTDGITEHDRDPIRGEGELIEAARWAYERPELDPARAVATRVLDRIRGVDDAAALTLRLARAGPADPTAVARARSQASQRLVGPGSPKSSDRGE